MKSADRTKQTASPQASPGGPIAKAGPFLVCDFVQTYEVLFRTIFVFFMIELESRRVVHFGVTRSPSDVWVAQQWRNATPFEEGPPFLIP